MTKRTYQLYASITASGDALASIMLPVGGRLKRVLWCVIPTTGTANGDTLQLELSVNAARQNTTNEATGIVSMCSAAFAIVTSGGSWGGVNFETSPDCTLKAGDKLYLHAAEAGSATHVVRVLLSLE